MFFGICQKIRTEKNEPDNNFFIDNNNPFCYNKIC